VTSVKSGSVVSNYDYDAVGRQITGPSRKIEPNNFDLPKDVLFQRVSNAFKYDAFQSRASKKNLPNNRTVYFEDLYEERISGNNVSYIFYIYGSERVISQVNWSKRSSTFQPDSILYLHDDHLGSIETVTDSQGALVDRLKFSPFGARHNGGDLASPTTLPLGNVRRGFAGHEHDESGFINMKGRMYDPQLGRFLSPDPLVGNPSNGQAYNRYSYALNNPLRYTDPTGLQVDQGSWGPPSSPGSEATYNGPTVVVVAPSETPTGAPTIGAPSSSEQVSRWDADDQGAKRVALPTPPDAPQPGKNPPEGSDLGSTRGQGWVEFIQQVISKIDLSRTTEENRAIFREAYEKADKLQDLTLEERQVSADKALENFQDTGRNAGAAIAGGVAKNAGNILPIPNFRRFAPRARLRLGPGAASAEQFVDKVVNSNMGHAAKRAVERAGFRTEKEAREALQKLGAEIQHGGVIPSTAIQDTAHIDRIIVPGFGQGGAVVYQVRNGVLKLKTVLEWRPPVLPPG
jgi:RHS repeat-associated protein